MARFKNKYGYFSDDGREYIITRPDTPRPWINVISNGEYSFMISQAGGGYSWYKDSNLNALTAWREDLLKDELGKFIYIRDNESGEVWSATYKPVCKNPQRYECRHGVGYTLINSKNYGIDTELLLFTPPDKSLELWRLKVKNTSNRTRSLSIFTYLEWRLGPPQDTHKEFHKLFIETSFDPNLDAIFATSTLWDVPGRDRSVPWDYIAFHSASKQVSGFDCDRESFIGIYRSEKSPIAVETNKIGNRGGKWVDPIASLKIDIVLPPGKEETIIFTLGVAENREEAAFLINKYKDERSTQGAFDELGELWRSYLDTVWIVTPDDSLNILANIWLKYQTISGRLWARAGYYQQSGGFGFRDQLQDSQVFLPIKPSLTKKQILLHSRHQFYDGTVYHWWHDISEVGVRTNMTDDLLWLPYVVINYLKETSGFSILEEKARYVDKEIDESLYIHCCRAIDKALERMSPRGLPLVGDGDWNDGMNGMGRGMKGESIWLGHFVYGILREFAKIVEMRDRPLAENYRKKAEEIKDSINRYAWDGRWYLRGTKDDGTKVGSNTCKEGKIFLNAQTWAVINGVAEGKRKKIVIASVEDLLDREYGPLLLFPAYSSPDEHIGYLTRYPPGSRENGGRYTHAATWAIMAECKLGRGDRAYEMYRKLSPINCASNPDIYLCEPYVLPGDVFGPDSPHFGRGNWSWYTGSAAWLFRVITEWILGIRPAYEGLLIDPCIPKKWTGFRMRRPFRGAVYEIEVKNPDHLNSGIKEIRVDGERVETGIVPAFSDGREHKVSVVMG
ncbi:glycosyl transferase family 36 [candidate division WOR-3 bacterium JGI_Cruoil_03_44_89]|uniref:Glycosyl transferase family 36 n=1 Tax=candidate division WOR-3 bacterium JGI_Cruoil_03_44_89 TaxID=1973748 RepID=A0A235BYZ9_UNCW3|nr:MAG: glycosyl transferase family 36 [candidate division WOR-3 bacterium JGI_Cruoil_03_44_89]